MKQNKGIAQIAVMAIMLFLAIALPVTMNLVQKSQENRSKAANTCIYVGAAGNRSSYDIGAMMAGKIPNDYYTGEPTSVLQAVWQEGETAITYTCTVVGWKDSSSFNDSVASTPVTTTCESVGGFCVGNVPTCTGVEGGEVVTGTTCSGDTPICCKLTCPSVVEVSFLGNDGDYRCGNSNMLVKDNSYLCADGHWQFKEMCKTGMCGSDGKCISSSSDVVQRDTTNQCGSSYEVGGEGCYDLTSNTTGGSSCEDITKYLDFKYTTATGKTCSVSGAVCCLKTVAVGGVPESEPVVADITCPSKCSSSFGCKKTVGTYIGLAGDCNNPKPGSVQYTVDFTCGRVVGGNNDACPQSVNTPCTADCPYGCTSANVCATCQVGQQKCLGTAVEGDPYEYINCDSGTRSWIGAQIGPFQCSGTQTCIPGVIGTDVCNGQPQDPGVEPVPGVPPMKFQRMSNICLPSGKFSCLATYDINDPTFFSDLPSCEASCDPNIPETPGTPGIETCQNRCMAGLPTSNSGNANCDSSVNIVDFSVWRSEAIDGTVGGRADFNCDGAINIIDFSIWRNTVYP